MTALNWTIVPGGIFARAPIDYREITYAVLSRPDGHEWTLTLTRTFPAITARGRRKAEPERIDAHTTKTNIPEHSLAAMKELSQDDYDGRTK